MRGFTAQNDIYLDGFRDRNQYYRDTFDLEEIEVLYGPSSMLFGRGSTGGVINQVSKKANLKDSAEVTGMIGTDDRYRSTVDVNHKLTDTSAIRLNAFGQSLGSTRDEMKNKDYGIAPEVRFGIGTPTEVTISALIQHNYDMPDYGVQALNGRPSPVPKNTFYGLTTDRTIQDVQTFTAAIKHKFSDKLIADEPDAVLALDDRRARNRAASCVDGAARYQHGADQRQFHDAVAVATVHQVAKPRPCDREPLAVQRHHRSNTNSTPGRSSTT